MAISNLFAPSSQEHCAPCEFSSFEPGDLATSQAEQALVFDHLHETFDEAGSAGYSSKSIQESALSRGVDAGRLMAARVCANTIQMGNCPKYAFINRGRGRKPKLELKSKR